MLMKGDDHSKQVLLSVLRKIDEHLGQKKTRFLTGDTLCCFDCELMPKLQHIRVAGTDTGALLAGGVPWLIGLFGGVLELFEIVMHYMEPLLDRENSMYCTDMLHKCHYNSIICCCREAGFAGYDCCKMPRVD